MKKIQLKNQFLASLFVILSSLISLADGFPVGPDIHKTPGDICENSPTRRYPEGIVYCERNVDTELKNQIIREYDQELGYDIGHMNRQDFKIDHFIPLSIGGSNSRSNLWPQHKSVFEITDPLEHVLHEKISIGAIKQAEAIQIIKEAKYNLDKAPQLIEYVQSL